MPPDRFRRVASAALHEKRSPTGWVNKAGNSGAVINTFTPAVVTSDETAPFKAMREAPEE